MTKEKIMIVEDEQIVALDIKDSLEHFGYSVPCMASSGEEAIRSIDKCAPDLILMDIVLKGKIDGVEAAKAIHEKHDIPVIYLTAYSDEKTLQRAKLTEPFGHILKPFDERELRTNIEIALYKREKEKEKLFDHEKWINSLLNNFADAIISTDKDGIIKYMNPLAQALTGYSKEEALGSDISSIFKVICEDSGKCARDPSKKVLQEGAFFGLDENTILISRDNTRIPLDVIGSPITNQRNEIIGTVIVFYDITDRKKVERSFHNYDIAYS
ncbi:ATP-binding response regulator [Methanolobus profundi]|uniref:PAS domain S-box-containing protein n=1 Tax=Methanolobus profundi TaxID=487685 RepID=A0A1I4S0K0_9EURY|nr:response regulator [Methanolobus profundi]SFM57961.1 PAS domain S-box-containing protein [Methanolobus profundi]